MAKIMAPNEKYNGISAGVNFRDGVGETDKPHLIEWFQEHGYEVEEAEDKQMKDSAKIPVELLGMDIDELKAYAEANEINIRNASTKEGILKKIKDALAKE